MRRRSMVVLALIGASLAVSTGDASAGGSWLETERNAYAVGERVVARGAFSSSGALEGRISDGPYFAYLVPENRLFDTPGPIPDYAIPIGPMTIGHGTVYRWVARVEFTAPDARTGHYAIQYCNDPCTVNGLGDLIGGGLFIGATVDEARLAWRAERLGYRIDGLKRQRTKWSEKAASLERQLADAEAAASEAESAIRVVPVPADAGSENRPLVPGWAVVTLAAAVLMAALLLRRSRRPAIPDTVPPELVESVQVPLRQPATSGGSPGIVRASPGTSSRGGSPVTKS